MRAVAFSVLGAVLAGCATSGEESAAGPPPPSLERIAEDVWIHKSYRVIPPWGPVLSQGLVVKTENGVALIDTAWTDEETAALLAQIEAETGSVPDLAILTHAHSDKMGGMGALASAHVATRAHPLTNEDAPRRGLRPAGMTILAHGDFDTLEAYSENNIERDGPLQVFYPGPGHTRDNIVVYYAPAKILFGGCLIRPKESDNLGNTADADVSNWANAIRAVAARFPDARIVIPSHGAAGGRELFDHAIALAEAAANE